MPIALGAFHLLEPVGQGGMGQVWRAVHPAHQEPVAVKVVTAEKARDPDFRASFRREVQSMARLYHPGIVRIFDLGEVDAAAEEDSAGSLVAGGPFLVMEWAEGGWLGPSWRPVHWPALLAMLGDVLEALAHAHARGVIHRDLKPGNILVTGRDPTTGAARIKLSDFGLAHAMEWAHGTEGEESPLSTEVPMGTPAYMAPEQCRGHWRDYGTWSDLYSLGCVAYELACGRPPFVDSTPMAVLMAQVADSPPRLTPRFDVPSDFEGWVARLLLKDPTDRFTRAADAAWALRQLDAASAVRSWRGPPAAPVATLDATAPLDPEELPRAPSEPESSATTVAQSAAATVPQGAGALRREPRVDAGDGALRAEPVPFPEEWRGATDDAAAMPVGLGLFGLRPAPFVDRDADRDTIWRALASARRRASARALVIQGPAGVGKSRLAEWATQRAHELGAAEVLKAGYSPRPAPGDGFGGALARYLRCVGLPRPKLVRRTQRLMSLTSRPDDLVWLAAAELMAPWTERDGDTPRLHLDDARQRFAAIGAVLRTIARWRPVVLWLDDVQWGLEAIGLVHYLFTTREEAPCPILLLLTCRQEALAERPEEAALLEQLLTFTGVEHMQLEELLPEHHRALIERLLQLEPALAERLETRTAGNPLFAVQLVGDWVHRGALELGEDGFRLRPGEPAELPDSIHSVWVARIEQLLGEVAAASGPEAAGVQEHALELAAALGQHVSTTEWRDAAGPAAGDATRALLDALISRQLAVVRDEQSWSFVHAMFRESIERRSREAGRWRTHNAVCAELLLPRMDADAPAVAERLAGHLLAAGDAEAAVDALLTAGGGRTRLGDPRAGLAGLGEAERVLLSLGRDESDMRWGRLRYWRATAFGYLGRRQEAYALAQSLRRTAAARGWRQLLADATRFAGHCERELGNFPEATRLCGEALEIHRELGDIHGEARDLFALSEVAYFRGELDEADRLAEAAAALYERDRRPFGVSACLRMRGACRLQRGQHESARALLEQAMALSDSMGNRRGVAVCLSDLGELARAAGDFGEAERCYRASVAIFQSLGLVEVAIPQANLALNLLRQRRFDEGGPLLRAVCREAERLGRRALLGSLMPALMACDAADGDWEAWDRHFEVAAEPLGQVETDTAWFAEEAGRLAATADETDRARQAWTLAQRHWTRLGMPERAATVQRLLDRG